MDVEKYKRVAFDCAEVFAHGYVDPRTNQVTPYEPAEYQMGLTLALALYMKAMFPRELEEVYRLHGESLRLTLEELDKSHPDDTLDIGGFTL
jgi:hypothetical protein